MKKLGTVLTAVTSLLISPMAIAEIYKCDGPDGPVYSDMKCGPGAATVKIAHTSGVSGVSDETKAELAQKKANRAEDRANNNTASPTTNYQFNTVNTEPSGRWLRRPYRKPHDRPVNLPAARAKSVVGGRRR
jgi:hypothetical protein